MAKNNCKSPFAVVLLHCTYTIALMPSANIAVSFVATPNLTTISGGGWQKIAGQRAGRTYTQWSDGEPDQQVSDGHSYARTFNDVLYNDPGTTAYYTYCEMSK